MCVGDGRFLFVGPSVEPNPVSGSGAAAQVQAPAEACPPGWFGQNYLLPVIWHSTLGT